MKSHDLVNIFNIRITVGLLGESEQAGFWQSNFFSASSAAFLTPVFGKTVFHTQYYGVKAAASIAHDQYGKKDSFHLFRLPEDMELGLHHLLEDEQHMENVRQIIGDADASRKFLEDMAVETDMERVGPVLVGTVREIDHPEKWTAASYLYLNAFKDNDPVFPFFQDEIKK